VQYAIRHKDQFILINTLSLGEQDCLLPNTVSYQVEEKYINELLNQYDLKSRKIIIYGKHTTDDTAEKKYKQMQTLGFDVYLYVGGMFEWMLLQDIYGKEEFPTTCTVIDILKFKPGRVF